MQFMLRPDWTFDCSSAKDGRLPAEDDRPDGVVITGSVASVNDDAVTLALIEAARAAGCRLAILGNY
jgi:GMP synthase-like glutamine amidotransferase